MYRTHSIYLLHVIAFRKIKNMRITLPKFEFGNCKAILHSFNHKQYFLLNQGQDLRAIVKYFFRRSYLIQYITTQSFGKITLNRFILFKLSMEMRLGIGRGLGCEWKYVTIISLFGGRRRLIAVAVLRLRHWYGSDQGARAGLE